MDFQLTEDQLALQKGVRDFCEGRVPNELLAELEQKRAFDRGLWGELAEMGVFSLRMPESEDGVGLGNADAVLVFAELGRRIVPGPAIWSHLAAGMVAGAASGETVVGGLDLLGESSEPVLVEHFEHLDALLVLRADGVYRLDPRSLGAEPADFGVVSRFEVTRGKGQHWAHPVIADGVLYIRHGDVLMAFDIRG